MSKEIEDKQKLEAIIVCGLCDAVQKVFENYNIKPEEAAKLISAFYVEFLTLCVPYTEIGKQTAFGILETSKKALAITMDERIKEKKENNK